MADERGYTRQTRPQAGAPMPQVSPDSYGAGLGRAIGDAAEGQHRQNLRGYEIARKRTADAERSTAFERWTGYSERVKEQRREWEANAAPGADGHQAAIEKLLIEDDQEALFEGITEDSVRQWLRGQLTGFTASERGRAQDFATLKYAERAIDNAETSLNRLVNSATTGDDINAWRDAHDQWSSYVEGLQGVEGNKRVEMLRNGQARIDIAQGRKFMRDDPGGFIAFLDQGVYDDTISPTERQQLRNEAEAELRSQMNALQTLRNQQEAELKEQVSTLIQRDNNGEVIADADFAAAEAAVRALGDTSLAEQIRGIRSDNLVTRAWGPASATPIQRERRMAELASIPPDQRTSAQSLELRSLETKSPGWDKQFYADPAGALAVHGGMPPLDLTDAASVAARSQWARAQSRAAGIPVPPLTDNEAADLKAAWATGQTASQRAVLDQIAAFPADLRGMAARTVAPDDPQLEAAAALPKLYRDRALRGRDVLKAKPRLLSDPIKEDPRLEDLVTAFDGYFDEALRNWEPAQRAAVHETALRLLAGGLDETGGEIDQEKYWNALNMALGARWRVSGNERERLGGLGSWGNHWFVLPDGVSPREWGAAVQRAAAGGAVKPVNPDGTPATLRNARPLMVDDGLYEFRSASGAVVRGSDGKPWRVRVGRAR